MANGVYPKSLTVMELVAGGPWPMPRVRVVLLAGSRDSPGMVVVVDASGDSPAIV